MRGLYETVMHINNIIMYISMNVGVGNVDCDVCSVADFK